MCTVYTQFIFYLLQLVMRCLYQATKKQPNKQSPYYRNRFLTWLTHVQLELYVHLCAGRPNYGILLYRPHDTQKLVVLHNALIVYLFYTIPILCATLCFRYRPSCINDIPILRNCFLCGHTFL